MTDAHVGTLRCIHMPPPGLLECPCPPLCAVCLRPAPCHKAG